MITEHDNDERHGNAGNPVSKHPDPTIGESELSLADIKKQRSHPLRWIAGIIFMLVAIIAPYWYGRSLASRRTVQLVEFVAHYETRGIALLGWSVTMVAFIALAMTVMDNHRWPWFIVFVVALAAEQFVAGMSLLKFNFWNSTYVMYGDSSPYANAANLGIIAAAVALAVFAVLWVGMLIAIKKDSPLNVFTRSWVSFLSFFAVEVAALMIIMFGGMLTTV